MSNDNPVPSNPPGAPRPESRRQNWSSDVTRWFAIVIGLYLLVSYLTIPLLWREAEGHPALAQLPQIARTKDNIPGDPLNIALVGPESTISRSMLAAGWHPADPLTLKSCLRIAADTILREQYTDAPVSNLYVWGHKQDLAFEQPVGHDPRRRHHVRFWRSAELDQDGFPLWIGGATFDEKVGLSHTTGQITHHISPEVDVERDKILADLKQADVIGDLRWIADFHTQKSGRNGGGDRWETDGRLPVVHLKSSAAAASAR